MQSYTIVVLAAIVAMALAEGQFYVPRSYYIIDAEGHESAPVPLRRLRRSLAPYPYISGAGGYGGGYGGGYPGSSASANANANANANSWGNSDATANANANAHAGGGSGGWGNWGAPGVNYGSSKPGLRH